ncbi:GNAT family N-acetyltransferase [Paenibacillus sp. CC-CFT747]|nr:GNAT family N-acetyltransferase [Paenibacillus sp. CC-CFT747]
MDLPDVVVRKAQAVDLVPLGGLMREYITDFYGCPEPPKERLEELMRVLLDGKQGIQWVAEEDGLLSGFATLYFTYSTLRARPVVILNDLYVVEKSRGTGAAAALFEACTAYARENGYAAMSWETAPDNERAQRFYAKMGGTRGDWLSYSIEL